MTTSRLVPAGSIGPSLAGGLVLRLGFALGDLVSAPRCAACDARLGRRALLCATCAATVERWQGDPDPLAYGMYGGALASALRRLKYGGRPDLGPPLGALLLEVVAARRADLGDPEVVVPVPMPRSRLLDRGYNQAALIGRVVARGLGVRFAPLALRRAEGGTKQAALGRLERLENLKGAFGPRDARAVARRRVLLVDDVSTTGATVAACTDELRQAGASGVRAAVVARAISDGG